MANKKRKTLQIKRPDPTSPLAKKKTLPKVVDPEDAAKNHPKTAQVARPDATKGATRVKLPEEDKIRQARESDASEDLQKEEAIPGAAQVDQLHNNATMPIVIEPETVGQSGGSDLPDANTGDDNDKTMQIDADALEAEDPAVELEKAGQPEDLSDQTLEIDPATLEKELQEDALASADAPEDKDQTLEIDPATLKEQTPIEDATSQETMKMETMPLSEGIHEELVADDLKETFNAQTMAIDPAQLEKELEAPAPGGLDRDTFSAQTMAMDADQLEKELSKKTSKVEEPEKDANSTMDLSQTERPKTIMIKRPSRGDSAPNAPTLKASRPAPGRPSRPVTANRTQPKEGTSRIDVPGAEAADDSKENKTIKLRRPAGASVDPSKVSRVAQQAGLELNADGTVKAKVKHEKPLGGGWLAVAIITFLISCGALWVLIAPSQPELPMYGRLVDVTNQLIIRP